MLTMRRWLLTTATVLTLVTIGGQCRGSLAQTSRVPETLTKDDYVPLRCDDGHEPPCGGRLWMADGFVNGHEVTWNVTTQAWDLKRRVKPMTSLEWNRAYEECIKVLGLPVILATRTPGISAGVGCVTGQD